MNCRGCGCDAPLSYGLCGRCRVVLPNKRLLNILGQAVPYSQRGARRYGMPRCTCGRDYATVPLENASDECPAHSTDERY